MYMNLMHWAGLPVRLAKRVVNLPRELLSLQRDTIAMHMLAPLNARFQPFTPYSMRPAGILAMVNDVVINRRRMVVECGPGLSTFYLARVLKPVGGRLISIDHSAEWLDVLHDQLRAENLADIVTLVLAPLMPGDWGMGQQEWYNPDAVRLHVQGVGIDMLVVDGPVASSRERRHARFPAVPFLRPFLAPNASVFLDDINRAGEREIIRRWSALLNCRFYERVYRGRIGVGRIGEGLTA